MNSLCRETTLAASQVTSELSHDIRLCEYHAPKKFAGLVAAPADLTLRTPSAVTAQLRHLREARAEAVKQFGVKRVPRLGERVVLPGLLLPDADESGTTQVGQMARRRRLRDTKDRHEVAYTQLAALQQVQNTQPRAIRERTKEPIDRESRRLEHLLSAV